MDWSTILSTPPHELSAEQFQAISNELPLVDVNSLGNDELKKFFELNRFLIEYLSKGHQAIKTQRKSEFFSCIITYFSHNFEHKSEEISLF